VDKLYIARLIIFFGDDWSSSCNFNYKVVEGNFSKNEDTGIYEGMDTERGALIQVPISMKSKESNNVLEVVQGFDRNLTEEELLTLKSEMKENILSLLKEYKDNYIKTYERKVSYIKSTTVA